MVLSASSVTAFRQFGNSYDIALRQGAFAVLGLAGAYLAVTLPLSTIRRLSGLVLLGSLLLIGVTFVPGVGVEVNGNRNWIALPAGFLLQPSEFAKLALIVWSATIYAGRTSRLRGRAVTRAIVMPVVPIMLLVIGLVVGQKDLGTALILIAISVGLVWTAGLPTRHLIAMGAVGSLGLVYLVTSAAHRIDRISTLFNPLADPEHTGYQSIHSMMALATGGFWGVGLGGSRQKWGALPNAHTDFILAVVGEELGLFGSVVVISLFAMLAYAGIRIALRTRDPFAQFVAVGITVWISVQAAINIGMVLGLFPVIGIPLPLMSYGGSSLVVTMTAIGLLANCALTEPGARRARDAAKRTAARSKARSSNTRSPKASASRVGR